MPDFWLSSGYYLLERAADNQLAVTDDYLRAYFNRPEVVPVEESCDAERALHAALMEAPRRAVTPAELLRIEDEDARENYEIVLNFRDHLLRHGTIEAAYAALFKLDGPVEPVRLAPIFLDQMVHVILRGLLEGCEDPFRLRAAELLFRSQKVTIQDGNIMLADEEVIDLYASTGGFGDLGRLIVEAQTPLRQIDLDVMTEGNVHDYWERADRFDMVLDITFGRPGLDALCRVLEVWIAHFVGADVRIGPVQSISDDRWSWHVGLDSVSTNILNELYEGQEVSEERLADILSLFRLEFRDANAMLPQLAGRPIYLGLAKGENELLRVKPQNLLVNLPLAETV
ncbi:MAG: hypothetical protein H5U25_04005 [Oceanibaculum nanhaiense]|nr:hypothetical protein [Oceanibaculum nanhaiense]